MIQKTAIVLAAGLGTRMKSETPKVLHKAAGQSLIRHVVLNLLDAGVQEVRVVVGFGGELVKRELSDLAAVKFYTQKNQLGTADAVKSADLNSLSGQIMICNGDHPLITAEDYSLAFVASGSLDLGVVTCQVKAPGAFGRIVRNAKGGLQSIVEAKDATPSQIKIREINTGLYVVSAVCLKKYLPCIENKNSKKEFYLTDLVLLMIKDAKKVNGLLTKKTRVSCGVNNPVELAQAGHALYLRSAKKLMLDGVVVVAPLNTYIESTVKIGKGTVVEPGCMIKGSTIIGENCIVEAHCQIVDSQIADGCHLRWGSVIEKSKMAEKCSVGPYARLRPETELEGFVHIGNFVELKKTKMGAGAKAGHLSYLGDAVIGEGTNIGCGTITCNYAVDKKKYKTVIGKNVFVGSDSQFVAPVNIGDHAIIGSGSTITKDVPARALGVARSRQFTKENYNKE